MSVTRNYTVTYVTNNTSVDITAHVISIDKLLNSDCFYKISSSQIMLSSKAGRFINSNDTSVGGTPILKHFDIIKIKINKHNKISFVKNFYIDAILPQESATGNQIQLELVGMERYLEKFIIPGHWFFITVKDLTKKIITFWNSNKGDNQPQIIIDSLDFPDYPLGSFDFGDGVTILEAFRQMVSWLNLPVQSGGAGKMHSILFSDAENNNLSLRIFPQGKILKPDIILQNANNNTHQIKITRTHEQYESNVVVLRGESGSGGWPLEISERTAKIEEYNNFPKWNNTTKYVKNIYVKYNGMIYKSIVTPTISIPPSSPIWNNVTEGEYIESDNTTYSPLTSKSSLYLASTLRGDDTLSVISTDTSLDYPAFVDSNLIIREKNNRQPNGLWQDECILRIKNINSIPDKFLFPGNGPKSTRVYEGMKLLLDDNILGEYGEEFSGVDKNQRSYSNALVQLDRDGDWLVVKSPERNDVIMVRSETKAYEFQKSFTPHSFPDSRRNGTTSITQWRDISTTPLANHCFHYPTKIINIDNQSSAVTGGIHHRGSATQIEYLYNSNDNFKTLFKNFFSELFSGRATLESLGNSVLTGLLYTRDWYSIGWWVTLFETPFPVSQIGNSTVGSEYLNPVLDANNRNLTPSGKTGYTASDGEALDILDGFSFLLNLDVQISDGVISRTRYFQGAITMRATIYDTEGNVWIKDTTYRLAGETQPMIFLFSEFSIYRARAPLEWFPTIQNISPSELHIPEIPERRKIKRITLQIQDVYDEYGRYNPSNYGNIFEELGRLIVGSNLKHIGWIDAFEFIKSPIAVAKQNDNNIIIMSKIKNTTISNVEQLKKAARATLDLTLHRNDIMTIEQPISLDYSPGDSLYLDHKYIINEHEKPINTPNTKRVIVIDVNYFDNNKRGLVQQIHVIKEIGT